MIGLGLGCAILLGFSFFCRGEILIAALARTFSAGSVVHTRLFNRLMMQRSYNQEV